MVKKLLEHSVKINQKKTTQKEFRIEKVIKRKGNKLYVIWKGCDNWFNSWIDKKDIMWKWVNIFLNYMIISEEMLKLNKACPVIQQKQI